jgi:AAA domain-containing protein
MEDEHIHSWPALGIQISIERFHEDRNDIKAFVTPQAISGDGYLPPEKVSLESARSLKMYANTLDNYGMLTADEWLALLVPAAKASLERYRSGTPAVFLHAVQYGLRSHYLLEPFIEVGSRGMIFGDGGVSKSLHALAMCISVATGIAIVPNTIVHQQGAVLYLDWEDEAETHAQRLAAICKGAGIDIPENIIYMRRTGSLKETVRAARRAIAANGCIMAVIDSVGAACGGDPERAADVIQTFDSMRALEVAVLAIHHVPKDQKDKTKPFGSVYAPNLVRTMWRLDKSDGQNGQIYVRGHHLKFNNTGRVDDIGHSVRFHVDENRQLDSVVFTPTHSSQLPPSQERGAGVKYGVGTALKDGPMTVADLAAATGFSGETVRRTLNRDKDWFVNLDQGKIDARWALLADETSRDMSRDSDFYPARDNGTNPPPPIGRVVPVSQFELEEPPEGAGPDPDPSPF